MGTTIQNLHIYGKPKKESSEYFDTLKRQAADSGFFEKVRQLKDSILANPLPTEVVDTLNAYTEEFEIILVRSPQSDWICVYDNCVTASDLSKLSRALDVPVICSFLQDSDRLHMLIYDGEDRGEIKQGTYYSDEGLHKGKSIEEIAAGVKGQGNVFLDIREITLSDSMKQRLQLDDDKMKRLENLVQDKDNAFSDKLDLAVEIFDLLGIDRLPANFDYNHFKDFEHCEEVGKYQIERKTIRV